MEFIIHRILAAPLVAEDFDALVDDLMDAVSPGEFDALLNLADAAAANVPAATDTVPTATAVATDDDDDLTTDEELDSGVCPKRSCVEAESPASSPPRDWVPASPARCLPLEVPRVKVVCRRAQSRVDPPHKKVPVFDVSDALSKLAHLKAWEWRQLNRQPAKCADTLEKTLVLYARARKSPEMAYNFAMLDEELALRKSIADAFEDHPKEMRPAIFAANPMHDVRAFTALIKGFLRRNQ